jgi:microcystin-dependent protein
MTYQIQFTETTNPAKPAIAVADQTLNNQTSLTFVGKNYAGYAPIIAEDFLHLLENFANNTAPLNPIEGQLWYDNAAGINLLKVYDGTTWNPAGSLKKGGTAPSVANSTKGDLWVDTNNSQLYLFSGSNWILVGPQYSAGTLTGPIVETIIDTDNVSHNIISMYANDYRISIISKETFTPKAAVSGFTTINEGVNLSAVNSTIAKPSRFWGTASSADGLLVGQTVVASTNFLRGDLKAGSSISNIPLNVRSNGGISVGSDLSFNIGSDANSTIFYSKNSGNSVDFKLNNSGTPTTVLHLDAGVKVGIGENNTNPASTLDVAGIITSSGGLTVTGTTDSSALGVGSINTAGGLSVALKSTFGDDISTYGQTFVNYFDNTGNPVSTSILQPGSDAGANTYDIGTEIRPFRNVYAQTFVGNFNGVFTGALEGSISGSAAKLASPTAFSLTGDVTSNVISFDGQTTSGTAIFTTSINQNIITSKTIASDSQLTDQFLVYRQGSGLLNMNKQTLLNHVATMPIGSILPFAGQLVPTGYLLCDGSEVKISVYPGLYSTIGYAYKDVSLLVGAGTFALPDLRGRFPLGRDNMDNNLTVPSKDGSGVLVSAGGGIANRVTDVTADNIGSGTGSQTVQIAVVNLPDHKHNLNSGAAQYYAGGLPGGTGDPNAVPGLNIPGSGTGQGLPNSGSVIGNTGSAMNVMNPYQTINYIIFTGVI